MAHTKSFIEEFCTILVQQGAFSQKESFQMQRTFAESTHEYFDDFLLEEGLIEKEKLLHALSLYYEVPSFDVSGYFFDTMLIRDFPEDFLIRNGVIPLTTDEDILSVVASDPSLGGLGAALRGFCSYEATFFVGIRQDIVDAIEEFHDKSLTDFDEDSDDGG